MTFELRNLLCAPLGMTFELRNLLCAPLGMTFELRNLLCAPLGTTLELRDLLCAPLGTTLELWNLLKPPQVYYIKLKVKPSCIVFLEGNIKTKRVKNITNQSSLLAKTCVIFSRYALTQAQYC
jgi:hypothetical protein